jgi:hypothetical protein
MGLKLHHLLAGVAVCIALSACESTTQTTSGRDYLRTYAQDAGPKAAKLDKGFVEAASVEPLLRFPARIGLARVDRGGLAGIPSEESAAWHRVATNLGPKFGEFVPVSPMIAELVAGQQTQWDGKSGTVRRIQLAAARQHLDAVIIYESEGTADSRDNPLSIGEWTLIGAFILPSQDVKARGVAQALMIDVRNTYPYGTASAEADDSTTTARFSRRQSERDLAETVRIAAVENLAPEVEKMMRNLRMELAEKREAKRGR